MSEAEKYTECKVPIYSAIMQLMYGSDGRFRQKYSLSEWDIYGSKRLGTLAANMLMEDESLDGTMDASTGTFTASTTYTPIITPTPTAYFNHILGQKRYELANHLGNVLAVISDKSFAPRVAAAAIPPRLFPPRIIILLARLCRVEALLWQELRGIGMGLMDGNKMIIITEQATAMMQSLCRAMMPG